MLDMRKALCRGGEVPASSMGPHHGAECASCPVRSSSICDALTDQEIVSLSAISRHVNFVNKQVIGDEGEPAHSVCNLVTGCVLLSKILPHGDRQVVGIALPGDFLGLALSDRNVFTMTAVGDVQLCQYPRERFGAILDAMPDLLRRLHESTAHELSFAQEHMVLLGRRSATERMAKFLLSLQARWARIRGFSPRIDLLMNRVDIADYLGLTIETVSRTLSKFARDKVLAIIPDGVRILDQQQLETLSGD